MESSEARQPIVPHLPMVACVLAALGTVLVSAQVNLHSVAWLLGIYLTLGLFIYVWRIRNQPGVLKPFLLYLAIVNQYFMVVWLLHVWVPGRAPALVEPDVRFWAHVFGTGSILVPVAVYHFAIRLCDLRARIFHALEWLGWGLAAYFFYCNSAGLFTLKYVWAGFTWVPTMAGAYGLYMEYVTLFCLAAIIIPALRLPGVKDPRRKQQIFYFLVGFGLWVLTCMAHMLITLGIKLYPFGGLAFLLHISLLAYALLKKRLFNFVVLVRTGLVYAFVSAFFGILFGGLSYASSVWLAGTLESNLAVTLIPVIVLAGMLYGPALNLAQRVVDRRFGRVLRIRSAILEDHAKQIAYTLDLKEISASVCKSMFDGTGAESVTFLVQEDPLNWKPLASFPGNKGADSSSLSEVSTVLCSPIDHPRLLPLEHKGPSSQEPLALSSGTVHLLVPIRHQDQLVAAALLAPKSSDEPYTEEEIHFAEGIAAQSALALANARSYTSIRYLREMTSQTLEGLTAGVLLVDRRQRVVVWNESARRLLHWQKAQADFSPTLDDLKACAPQLAEILSQAIWDARSQENVELAIDHPKARTLLLSTRPLAQSERETLMLVLLNDVTEYKEMEKVLRRQEGLARLGQLIATINHEVRNILQPLRNQVEGLRDDVEQSEKGQRHLENIQNRLKTLDDMLANLKNLARPLELRPRAFQIKPLLETVCRDVRDLVANTAITIRMTVADETPCYGDGAWLRQVLFNLVRNAVEATDGQAQRQVEVSAATENAQLLITVRDNGWGISEASRERIFEPFYSTKGTAGTGLGLAVTRKIVEAHGGKIDVWSQPGMGSKFTVMLPLPVDAAR